MGALLRTPLLGKLWQEVLPVRACRVDDVASQIGVAAERQGEGAESVRGVTCLLQESGRETWGTFVAGVGGDLELVTNVLIGTTRPGVMLNPTHSVVLTPKAAWWLGAPIYPGMPRSNLAKWWPDSFNTSDTLRMRESVGVRETAGGWERCSPDDSDADVMDVGVSVVIDSTDRVAEVELWRTWDAR